MFDKNYEFYINFVNKVVSFYEKNYNDDFISVLKLAEGEEYKYIFFPMPLYENLKSGCFEIQYDELQHSLSLEEKNILSKPELNGIVYLSKDTFLCFDKNIVKEIHIGKKSLDLNSDILKKMSDEDRNITGLSMFDASVRLVFEASMLEMDEFNRIVRDYSDDKFIYEELLKSICKQLIINDKQFGTRRAIIFLMDYDRDLEFKEAIIKYIENDIRKNMVNVRKRKKDSN